MRQLFIYPTLPILTLCAASSVSANDLNIGVAVDKSHYQRNADTLGFSVSAGNSGTNRNVDVHLGFIASNGQIYELPDWNTRLQPWITALNVPAGFNYPSQTIARLNLADTRLTPGPWVAAAAFTEAGSLNLLAVAQYPFSVGSAVVDTSQSACYDNFQTIGCPAVQAAFYGQDAQHSGHQAAYQDNGNGTVSDLVTGLIWQQSPDSNGDGRIDADDKFTFSQAQAYADNLNAQNFGGYNDWRLPSIKELYSLIDFQGTDPSGYTGNDTSGLTPFIDTRYFTFGYGDTGSGERIIDAQFASSTRYVSTTMGGQATMFGVNFADGRIKGYPIGSITGVGEKTYYLLCVRGDSYGEMQLTDNGDGTVSDPNSGLMWMQQDSAAGMNWQQALAWAAQKNAEQYLGYNDWRLPNAKELQSLIDYTRSPDTTASAAIDPLFASSAINNEAGQSDYPFYWTSTTHLSYNGMAGNAAYIAFGRAMGYMNGTWMDVHGAGAQRSDPKTGNASDYPTGHGPQGDAIRINNYVRLVRDIGA